MKSLHANIRMLIIALLATLAYGADKSATDSDLVISGWALIHPVLPKPMKGSSGYKISFASQKKGQDGLDVTVEFVNERPNDNVPAVLTILGEGSVRQGSFAVIDGKIAVVDSYIQKRQKGRIEFLIAKPPGTRILLAGLLEPKDVGKSLMVLSNILELK